MSKKFNLSKRIKTVFLLVLMCLISISLTGCDRESYGSLNTDATYAQVGNFKVTVGEVYNELRYNAAAYINEFAVNVMYENELKTVRGNRDSYKKQYEEAILEAIYGSHDEETLKALNKADARKSVLTYIDAMYQVGYVANVQETTEYTDYEKVLSIYNFITKRITLNDEIENKISLNLSNFVVFD